VHTYRAETLGIRVSVTPRFLPENSDPGNSRFFWAYDIEIANLNLQAVQLVSRHWIIQDGRGKCEEVKGAGVIGEQPVIPPGAAFQYTSGCPLGTPDGTMHGSYAMKDSAGSLFNVVIPRFALESPFTKRTLH
jgi:ApaG protein